VIERKVDDWIFGVRKHSIDLFVELFPRQFTPVVRHEHEPALQQVVAKFRNLVIVEHDRPGVFHQHEGALEQRRIRQPDDHIFRIGAGGLLGDTGLGEFGQADREVQVGAGVIGVPAALFAAVAAEHHPAEGEASLKALRVRESWWGGAVETGEDALRVRGARTDGEYCQHSQSAQRSPAHIRMLVPQRTPRARLRRPAAPGKTRSGPCSVGSPLLTAAAS
jgi:hypothetical protein